MEHELGLHRVLAKEGAVPQSALVLNAAPHLLHSTEALVDVRRLHLDSTSMRELRARHDQCGEDASHSIEECVAQHVLDTIERRGKMHNAVTDSGGVLIGAVSEIGPESRHGKSVSVGDMVVPLCSLTALPLHASEDIAVRATEHDVIVEEGHLTAVIFAAYEIAPIPLGTDEGTVLSLVDVSRLLPQIPRVLHLCTVPFSLRPEERRSVASTAEGLRVPNPVRVAILGGGKAGLCSAAAVHDHAPHARIYVLDVSVRAVHAVGTLGLGRNVTAHRVDLRNVQQVACFSRKVLGSRSLSHGVDLVLNCVNVAGTETSSVVLARNGGVIVYFSMATSFQRSVLSTDAIGKDVTVVAGAGVFPQQGRDALALLRRHKSLDHLCGSGPAPDQIIPLWMPYETDCRSSALLRFVEWLREEGLPLPPPPSSFESNSALAWYRVVHRWSIEHVATFWIMFWRYAGFGKQPPSNSLYVPSNGGIREASFFVDEKVNHAAALLRHRNDRIALVEVSEAGPRHAITFNELHDEVRQCAMGLRTHGVTKGDRVVALVPNCINTVVMMLAATSLGAIWSSCSPDMGTKVLGLRCTLSCLFSRFFFASHAKVLLDRFGSVDPKVLVYCASYTYNGKRHRCTEKLKQLIDALSSLELCIGLTVRGGLHPPPPCVSTTVGELRGRGRASVESFSFEPMKFDDPVYILFTSGTTGKPKCIVQGFGVTLNHVKETMLHLNLTCNDTAFCYTNCGWMVWHWLISVLYLGSTIVLYDGSPFYPSHAAMWDVVAREKCSYMGISARFLDACEKAGVKPKETHGGLPALKLITSTGSPLSRASSEYVYRDVSASVQLSSISGGTELNGCLTIGAPILPVYHGECQCAPLGMDVDVVDNEGARIVGTEGELVCFTPFPSKPVYFWNDPDNAQYDGAYFRRFGKRVWHHGDYATRTQFGGFLIHGRSDATLNPGGVRLGTQDYYDVLTELVPAVADSVVVGFGRQGDEKVALFVVAPGVQNEQEWGALVRDVRAAIRQRLSPKHTPALVVRVSAIPVNINGKKMEVLVKKVINGDPITPGAQESLQNRESLEEYREWAATQRRARL